MSKKMILLALIVSLAFIIGACASDRPNKGKIGDPVGTPAAVPGGANPVGKPLTGVDNLNTPAAKGKIGDPVGTPAAVPGGANPVGKPLTPGVDNLNTPAAKGTIGDPVGTPAAVPGGANPVGKPIGAR